MHRQPWQVKQIRQNGWQSRGFHAAATTCLIIIFMTLLERWRWFLADNKICLFHVLQPSLMSRVMQFCRKYMKHLASQARGPNLFLVVESKKGETSRASAEMSTLFYDLSIYIQAREELDTKEVCVQTSISSQPWRRRYLESFARP